MSDPKLEKTGESEFGDMPAEEFRRYGHELINWIADYFEHKKYIWANAVKRGLAVEASLYPYCSAHPGFELDPAPDFAG